MLVVGCFCLFVGSLLHTWWAANAKAHPIERAMGFYAYGGIVVCAFTVCLLLGLGMVWAGSSFFGALVALGIYLFLLPFVSLGILGAMGVIPPMEDPR